MEKKKKKHFELDPNSIKSMTAWYFVVFSLAIISIFWFLQDFFLNQYYETFRAQEALRNAKSIEIQYRENYGGFSKYANTTAISSGIYIRVESFNSTDVYDGTSAINSDLELDDGLKAAKDALVDSSENSIHAEVKGNKRNESYLIYASYLSDKDAPAILYVVAPLYPVQSTLTIMRTLLLYVSAIVMLLAFFLAIFLAKRLSAPIESITKSADEMSKGNYSIKFNGGYCTETKNLAKVLNQASYEMEQADFYQREIIANVSHDLKTPLTMIRSYAEMINDISGDNPVKRKEHLNVIISETERLNQLVVDMMDASKIQSNSIELHKEYFNLVDVVKAAYESFAILKEQEGYDITFAPCKKAIVYGDKARISQVVHNFLTNAVKYSGDQKYVHLEMKRNTKEVTVQLSDHGVGIAKDELNHVWDRYYRTSANHQRSIEGSGIGLSICKGILSLHNANYGVDSEEGKGSTFWFELPVEKQPK